MERGESGQGLTPEPPLLHEDAGNLSAREIFWIVKNGIKIAAMPAFGPTHTDDEIWALVAVVRRLPETTPEGYRAPFQPPPPRTHWPQPATLIHWARPMHHD